MLDRYIRGGVNRISPEAPIQILTVQSRDDRLGGAANVANNLAAFDAEVSCLGIVGRDKNGLILGRICRKARIRPFLIADRTRPTTLKSRMIAHHQQMLRVDEEGNDPVSVAIEEKLIKAAASVMRKGIDAIVVADYDKGVMTPKLCKTLVDIGRRRKIPLIVGLKTKNSGKYRGATAFSLNRSELAMVTGEHDLNRGAKKLLKSLSLQFLIVTLGEKGISLFARDGAPLAMPTQARDVFDVTGAGDTVLALFSAAYASGASLSDALHIANGGAGIVVGKLGTETVSREEIVAHFLAEANESHPKIAAMPQLAQRLKRERALGKSVVFTNGCYDLIHPGHVRTLRFAKSKGDILVVALNSDASVRRLKGKNRPLLSHRERAEVVASMEMVDYVVVFDEDTPYAAIRKIRPDVLIKGEDWKNAGVVGREFVESYGGRVELAPILKGVSTSGIVEKIRKSE